MENEGEEAKKSNNTLIILMVIAVLAVGGFFLVSNFAKNDNSSVPANNNTQSAEPTQADSTTQADSVSTGEKSFDLSGENFEFSLAEIRVKQGDKVTITFTSNEGFHDWVVDEFSARTQVIGTGKSETISFVADKKGTFEFYCSVGNHRAQGMVGNLIVE